MNNKTAIAIVTRSRDIIALAHAQLARELSVPQPENNSFDASYRMLDDARNENGNWIKVGELLGFNRQQILDYVDLMRGLRGCDDVQNLDPIALNKCLIDSLQIVNLLELAKHKYPQLNWDSRYSLPDETSEDNAVRQMRAIELLIRQVIDEAWADQQKLAERLQTLFGKEQVARIMKSAEKDNILSGTLLEQLRIIFSNQEDYPNYYDAYFDGASGLNYASTTRETLSQFLQSLNHIRNKIAHHKKLTESEMLLLNEYFDQVVEPLRNAHQQGRLQTDPDALYRAPGEAIHAYQDRLAKQMADLEDTGKGINKKLIWALAGIAGILVISGVTLHFSGGSYVNTEIIKNQVSDVQEKLGKVKQETSVDPRKELANLGVQWDRGTMEQAIKHGDLRTVKLFNEGGMTWDSLFMSAAMTEYGKNPSKNLADTIEYVTAHPENRINGSEYECRTEINYMRERMKEGSLNETLNGKIIHLVCADPKAQKIFAKTRKEAVERQSSLEKEYAEYNKPQAACVKELMKDDGDAVANAIFKARQAAVYTLFPNEGRQDISQRAATATGLKFTDYQYSSVSRKVFRESLKYYCDRRFEFAKQDYPPVIDDLKAQIDYYGTVAAKYGIKI
ncbi:STY4199 family HEPN domain-containing protein [Atlantibacter subterranea]|uniref:STY4199 family HEPN domain-containing protein n=1 Tax=Atlantibacter subterraneus TaxID=255519 RepID=A0ABU4DWP2_9ENTR|nr:STY4199 family HEPN domain-containing protein [Atlantibacter subterranea]MDV7021263.1 STY4199 family HEPN domain-containing protein [Atlantibacter subterranea]MDZ5664639.1 STY4199 family HEPN domain-containing protein [Atlantibacter hermannii]